MADAAPSAEDQTRYDTAKKELIQALAKKRALDKQLVRQPTPRPSVG
jgi:chromatin modification-related protein EAF6